MLLSQIRARLEELGVKQADLGAVMDMIEEYGDERDAVAYAQGLDSGYQQGSEQ